MLVIKLKRQIMMQKYQTSRINISSHLIIINSLVKYLKPEQDKITKLQAFDSSYFCGKSHSEDDGTHNYLVFQPVNKHFKTVANSNKGTASKSKGLSEESIKPPVTSYNSLNPGINYAHNAKM